MRGYRLADVKWFAGVSTKLLVIAFTLAVAGCVSQPPQPSPTVDYASVPKKNVTIALLGATGLAGGYILDRALAEGYEVRALARTPEKLKRYRGLITIVQGDALDVASLASLLQDSNVVISALGPVKADGDAAKMINSTVTAELLELMPKYSIQRYILVSGGAVVLPTDDRNVTGWLMRQLALIGLYDELVDKQAEYQLLADSSARWTLVRCPLIEAEPYVRKPEVSLTTPSSFSLRAGELARFVIDQVDSDEYVGEGPFLNSD